MQTEKKMHFYLKSEKEHNMSFYQEVSFFTCYITYQRVYGLITVHLNNSNVNKHTHINMYISFEAVHLFLFVSL